MTSDKKQVDAEQEDNLFDSEPSDGDAGSGQDTDSGADDSDSKAGEQGGEPLNLNDKEVQFSQAEIERQKQVDAWALKVIKGETSLDELSGSLSWLYLPVKKQLDAQNQTPDIEKVVALKMAEQKDVEKFQTLKDQLKQVTLSTSQKMEIEAEYQDLRGSGISKAKALLKAVKMAGVRFDSSDELRSKMTLPKSSGYREPENESVQGDLEKVLQIKDPQKRIQTLEKIRKARNSFN